MFVGAITEIVLKLQNTNRMNKCKINFKIKM